MRQPLFILALLIAISPLYAQTAPKPEDIAAIKGQCGCHDVNFLYAETFAPDKTYTFKDRYMAKGTELVFVDEELGPANKPTKLVIQHLLVVNDTMVIKHWREDWEFQNTSLLKFDQSASWKRIKLTPAQVKGQWTQKVFEVDDSPRYEGSATWIHVDGRTYWESTVDAPLPRREYTKRTDYNVMRRTNHHEIRPDGYVHEQDNDKIIRSEAGDQLLASEKGLNTYRRTDDAKCKAAKDFWAKHRAYWADVRVVWGEVLAKRDAVAIKGQVKGQTLGRELDELAVTTQKTGYNSAASRPLIQQTIEKYLK
ncbi:DUF6607 family protein [Spirosoma radiotolerans]|uniref:Uncharacterized protein n=1 Tax=Spirosoma radiotolerans TaxID=1379870 RepID=A0A0E3ZS14_9BACT|nr:DUF6607 family protein [Spirosoma radiotolerans]AKD54089.1 hypothetical protein SD10_03410 [Spirosoma radiotolerans]